MHSRKHWISIFLGLFVFTLGLLPLLSQLNIIAFDFKSTLGFLIKAFSYILGFAGFYLIIDSFHEISWATVTGTITLLLGIIFFGIGFLPLLNKFGIVLMKVVIPELFYYFAFMLEGVLLIIAGFID